MTLQQLRNRYRENLAEIYPALEIQSLFELTVMWVMDLSKIELHRHQDKNTSVTDEKKILEVLSRLERYEPLQYIMGFTTFYELEIELTPDVLIPRPETEYMVDLIVKKYTSDSEKRIMDLCTGSGCIALALAKNLPGSSVNGLDISAPAIKIAHQNAMKLDLKVSFITDNLLAPKNSYPEYDLIVSNPPYVREGEKKLMHKNVLNYEPSSALFVPDEDALLFYKAILTFASGHLKKGGSIFLEINEALGNSCKELFTKHGFQKVDILNDLDNKNRYLYAEK